MHSEPPFAVFIMAPMIMAILFIGLPWLVLHYVTKWRQAPKITQEDEKLLDEMYHLARRLDERVQTVERLVALDHPEARIGLDTRPPTSVGSFSRSVDTDHDLTRRN